jgi:uncharacterized RDD family membrane protein YckC
MDSEVNHENMDKKVNYAGIGKRAVAYIIEGLLFGFLIAFLRDMYNYYNPSEVINDDIYETVTNIVGFVIGVVIALVFQAFILVKFGGTPGQLLLGMRVKDKNTLQNVTLKQAVLRALSFKILSSVILTLHDISGSFLVLPIFILLLAVRDECRQALHDKIAKTVVINYKNTVKNR